MDDNQQSSYDKLMARLKQLTPWQWEFTDNEPGKWRFKVSKGQRSLDVVVPYRHTDKSLRIIIITVQKYFKFVGEE